MLNLLIISNNFKAESIKKRLQPMLKAKIDILGDFDLGLKEVFEKRPAIVVIQDQIDGVSAENVARHIQMLLGKGAPVFILMHDGSPAVTKVKGLFDHVVNLNIPAKQFLQELLSILKNIYGEQWQKIFISPVHQVVEEEEIVEEPVSYSEAAHRLVDELFSDLQAEAEEGEQKDTPALINTPVSKIENEAVYLATKTEEIAALLMESSNESRTLQLATEEKRKIKHIEAQYSLTKDLLPENPITPGSQLFSANKTAPFNSELQTGRDFVRDSLPQSQKGTTASSQPDLSKISDDILLSFEQNYSAGSSHWKSVAVIGLLVVCILAVGWYLLGQNLYVSSLFQKKQPAPTAAPLTQALNPASIGAVSSPAIQAPLSSAARSADKQKTILPSFVSSAGRDLSFSGKGPGWERYLDDSSDIRLFRSGGKIKAVQVLAVKGNFFSDTFMRNVLKEIVGSDQTKQLSIQQKQGFIMQRYSLSPKGELLVYRSKTSKPIHAFVVSLD